MISEFQHPVHITSYIHADANQSYFAAVGGDAPAFEAWPRKADFFLHEYLLALWGCLIGEMFDLEVRNTQLAHSTVFADC